VAVAVAGGRVYTRQPATATAKENLEMHHVKHIRKATEMIGKDYWTRVMSTNRKQIPVCRTCHNQIHKGEYDKIALKELSP